MRRWNLAYHARDYGPSCPRPPADPIGQRGLPADRAGLDRIVDELYSRVQSMAGRPITGERLCDELSQAANCRLDARAIRLLVRYAHVHLGRPEVVGLPGGGYYWAPTAPAIARTVIEDCRARGRSYFLTASLLKRVGTATALAQLTLDFMGARPDGDPIDDELAALMAVQGVRTADVVHEIIRGLASTPDGRAALAEVGSRNAEVLLPATTLRHLAGGLEQMLSLVRNALPAG